MFHIYATVVKAASRNALRAWPVAFSTLLYGAILIAAATVLGGNLVGGMILSLIFAACFSSYITLLENAVAGQNVRWADLQRGFMARFWDVVSVMFALWIVRMAGQFLARAVGQNEAAVMAMLGVTVALFFNVVPELLYQGQTRSFALLMDSARLVTKNWIGWFFPQLVVAAIVLALTGALRVSHPGEVVLLFEQMFSLSGLVSLFLTVPHWAKPLMLVLFHFLMVFRGLLFKELQHSNPRLRAFQAAQKGL